MTIVLDAADVRFAAAPRMPRALIVAGFFAYAALAAAAWWAAAALLPDQFALRLAGHAMTVRHIHDKLAGNAVLLLILPSVLGLECAIIGWEKSSLRALFAPTKSMKTDMAFLVLDQAHVMSLVGRVMMLGLSILSGV